MEVIHLAIAETIVPGIVIKSFSLDIGRVSGSTAVREWNTGLDLNLKFACFS